MSANIEINKIDHFVESKEYENTLDYDIRQMQGIYYTPKFIVKYIIENTLKKHDIVKNPCPKVFDISCGCGNFLLEVYDVIYDLIENNIYEIKNKYGQDYIKRDSIHKHIIENCIYGADIDSTAIDILKNNLIKKDEDCDIDKFNLYCCDSLFKEFNQKFDYIIGNPPYIGQKKLDNEYKKELAKKYSDVYKYKSDLYYCFYKKMIELIKHDGIISLITPRYFLESPSGKFLRNYIKNNISIVEIVDFLGCKIFKDIAISSCIITLKKNNNIKGISIFKALDEEVKFEECTDLGLLIESDSFEKFNINKESLDDEWLIVNQKDKEFLKRIHDKCEYKLDNLAISFQGIITGCDKAFVIKKDDKRLSYINDNLLKIWIKNKNVSKYIIEKSECFLIYSNDIKDESEYIYEVDEFIGKYKEKLLNRRECKKNIRKWYELQWGREKYLFEQVKIMYPYKSRENRFAIDYENSFCSADVYSFYIKEEYIKEISYEYLVGILNSDVYNKYFKLIAKKLGRNTYDYYPNKVMNIKIFKDENYEQIHNLSMEIINKLKQNKHNDIQKTQDKINKLIKESLDVQSLM